RRETGAAGGVVGGTEDDEQRVVVEGLELGPLPELARVLQRERVQLEDVAQQREIGLAGVLDVEPEEDPVPQARFDALRVDVGLDGSPGVDQVAGQARPSVLASPDEAEEAHTGFEPVPAEVRLPEPLRRKLSELRLQSDVRTRRERG